MNALAASTYPARFLTLEAFSHKSADVATTQFSFEKHSTLSVFLLNFVKKIQNLVRNPNFLKQKTIQIKTPLTHPESTDAVLQSRLTALRKARVDAKKTLEPRYWFINRELPAY
jgi:hypothetical protein